MSVRVVLIVSILTHYRVRFHELVRERLAAHGIRYDLVIGTPLPHEAAKGDTVTLPWATIIPSRALGSLLWQPGTRLLRDARLVIVTQENRLLLNYLLQFSRSLSLGRRQVAFFGHGRNFQARDRDSRAERWKRFWATRVDWWFGYTEETRAHVESLGFPADRITVFNNSVDTSTLRRDVAEVTPERLSALRAEMRLVGRNVGIFVGGIYADKRMAFLMEAADRIRASVPDFELIVVGAGPDLPIVQALAESRSWVHVMGPRFGREKVELMKLGHVFMMPGLMGLAILDAGMLGLPIATTTFPWHSPEIAYLEPDRNGLKVEAWENSTAYADAVAALLLDPDRRKAMSLAAREMADRFSIEAMAENFVTGVLKALQR